MKFVEGKRTKNGKVGYGELDLYTSLVMRLSRTAHAERCVRPARLVALQRYGRVFHFSVEK